MDKIEEFFHFISPKVIDLTNQRFENTKEIRYKDSEFTSNFATEGDFDNEKLIKSELAKWFPGDKIIAEETSPDLKNMKGRVWIVDPLCGSSNFQNGVKFFCTNVALSEDGILIASCVIDHSREEYVWSTGNSVLNIGKDIVKPGKRSMGIVIEVDLSAIVGQPSEIVRRQVKLVEYLLKNKKYYLSSYNTSLGFTYTALSRINAYANGANNIWDVAAANFLVMQAGGIVTEIDGKPWTLSSRSVLASNDHSLHKELVDIVKNLA